MADGQAQLQSHAYDAAALTLRRGIAVAEGLPANRLLIAGARWQLRLVQRPKQPTTTHPGERIAFFSGRILCLGDRYRS